jgi:hypothetical protein
MTPWMAQSLAAPRLAQLREGRGGPAPVAGHGAARSRRPRRAQPARWRQRVGRLLLEAGLHLLATTA